MINDLPERLINDTRLFADDTSILYTHESKTDVTETINTDLAQLYDWSKTWLIDLNPTKTVCMTVSLSSNVIAPTPSFRGAPISNVLSHKHLGVVLNARAGWSDHVRYIEDKVSKRIGILRSLKSKLTRTSLSKIYSVYIRPLLEYADTVWDNITIAQSETIEKLQLECLRIITGLPRYCSSSILYNETGFGP